MKVFLAPLSYGMFLPTEGAQSEGGWVFLSNPLVTGQPYGESSHF
jgi:hypothetical protein